MDVDNACITFRVDHISDSQERVYGLYPGEIPEWSVAQQAYMPNIGGARASKRCRRTGRYSPASLKVSRQARGSDQQTSEMLSED